MSPLSVAAWSEYASSLTLAGKFKDAVTSFNVALACAQDDAVASFQLATQASNVGMWQVVKRALSDRSVVNSNDPALILLKANALRRLKNVEASEVELKKLLEISPNFIPGILLLAGVKRQRNNKKDAETLLSTLRAEEPDCVEATYELAELMASDGRVEEARSILEDLGESVKETSAFICATGRLTEAEGEAEMAAECFRTALAIDSNSTSALLNLGELCLRKLGDRWKAFDYGRILVDLAPTEASSYRMISDGAMVVGEHGLAIEKLTNFLFLYPRDGDIISRIVKHRIERRDFSAAVQIGQTALGAQSKAGRLGIDIAVARCADGDWLDVIKAFATPDGAIEYAHRIDILVRAQQLCEDPYFPYVLPNVMMGTGIGVPLFISIFEKLIKLRELRKAMAWAEAIVRAHPEMLGATQWSLLADGAWQAGRSALAAEWRQKGLTSDWPEPGLPGGSVPAGSEIDREETVTSIVESIRSGRLSDAREVLFIGLSRFPLAAQFVQLMADILILENSDEQALQLMGFLPRVDSTKVEVSGGLNAGLENALLNGNVNRAKEIIASAESFLRRAIPSDEAHVTLIISAVELVIKYGDVRIIFEQSDAVASKIGVDRLIGMASDYLQKSNPKSCLLFAIYAIGLDPSNLGAHLLAARCFMALRDWTTAELHLRKVVLLQRPASLSSLDILSHSLEATGQLQEAIAVARTAYTSSGGTIVRAQGLARALRRTGQLDAEIEATRQELISYPDDSILQLKFAACLMEKGELGDVDKYLFDGFCRRQPSIDALELHVAVRCLRMDFVGARKLLAASTLEVDASPSTLRRLSLLYRRVADVPSAQILLTRAARVEPENASICLLLAEQLLEMGDSEGALREAQRLHALYPLDSRSYVFMGGIFQERGDLSAARAAAESAMLLGGRDTATLIHCGLFAELEGRYEDASALFDRCLETVRLQGQIPGARLLWHRVMCRLMLGDPQGAVSAHADLCEMFNAVFPETAITWNGEDLEGRDLLVVMRGGPGDELRVATLCLPWLLHHKVKECMFACDPRLASLLQRTFPEIAFKPTYSGHRQLRSQSSGPSVDRVWPGASARIVEMSVPFEEDMNGRFVTHSDGLVHRVYFEEVLANRGVVAPRHLVPDPKRRDWAREFLADLGGNLKIGVCWRGSYSSSYRDRHYLDVEEIIPILSVKGVRFVDLQVNKTKREIGILREFNVQIVDSIDTYNDFEGLSAIMSELDLVITPGVTIRDVAGALGVRVWSIIAALGADDIWRAGEDGTDCWQPSIRHFALHSAGSKEALVRQMVKELTTLILERKTNARGRSTRHKRAVD